MVGYFVFGVFCYFLFVIVWLSDVSTSALDCLERLVSEMTSYVLSRTSISHHKSLIHSLANTLKLCLLQL